MQIVRYVEKPERIYKFLIPVPIMIVLAIFDKHKE